MKMDGKCKYEQSYRISRNEVNQCFIKINDEKENMELNHGKKTNQPYIKTDYKIMEPKTKLTGILQERIDNE
jgi:hypothetical protein